MSAEVLGKPLFPWVMVKKLKIFDYILNTAIYFLNSTESFQLRLQIYLHIIYIIYIYQICCFSLLTLFRMGREGDKKTPLPVSPCNFYKRST